MNRDNNQNGCLVLSRRRDERIVLTCPDENRIEVVVIEIRDGRVRLGFVADRSIQIDRYEVDLDKQRSAELETGETI